MLLPRRIQKRNKQYTSQKLSNHLNDLQSTIKDRITNKGLLDEFLKKLTKIKKESIVFINDNEVQSIDKTTNQTIRIFITENEIVLEFINGNYQEKIQIQFDGDTIIVTNANVIKDTKKTTTLERKVYQEIYHNNDLIFKKEYQSKTTSDLDEPFNHTYFSELYINEDKEAAKRTIIIKDRQEPKITYTKSSLYDVSYNNVESNEPNNISALKATNQDDYDNFLANIKQEHYQLIKVNKF